MDGAVSADVTASIANDAAKLPAGSAVVVDDFHAAARAVGAEMADLVERWPGGAAELVLASRSDPPLRLHRLRMAGQLCELRDQDLCFSLAESGDLLARFGVQVGAEDLAVLHQRSEGWAAAVQMAALGCAALPIRRGPRGRWKCAARRSVSTSSPRFLISSRPRWPRSCSTPRSWEN